MSSASDQFVYKDAMASQGTPNIFLRKEVLSINDNMNGVYSSNSAVLDTSQLSNSNKYMDYKNARLIIPLLLYPVILPMYLLQTPLRLLFPTELDCVIGMAPFVIA